MADSTDSGTRSPRPARSSRSATMLLGMGGTYVEGALAFATS
jgi:hypothetical protein